MSPEKLALCGALGVTLGIFPIYGTTTFLCAIAAFVFRLNQAAIQVVNYAAYPLWFIMIVPFFKMGERIFSAPPIPFTAPGEIVLMFKSHGFQLFQTLGAALFHAAIVWFIISPFVGGIIYLVLLRLLKKRMP